MIVKDRWYVELSKNSKKFTVHGNVKEVVSGVNYLWSCLNSIFPSFSIENIPRVRAWVNGGQKYNAIDSVIDQNLAWSSCLENDLSVALNSKEFCVTLNGINSYDEKLSALFIEEVILPLFSELKIKPKNGSDLYTFIGNYGYTPFGVHDDLDHSVLFHIGPNKKVAYVWERSLYQSLTGGTAIIADFHKIIEYGKKYILEPGDALFIPAGDFHIFQTIGFSATVGITIFPENLVNDVSEGLRLLVGSHGELKKVFNKNITPKLFSELRYHAIQSNGTLIYPPIFNEGKDIFDGRELISTRAYYPILTKIICDRQALFVRNRIIWSKSTKIIDQLCDLLNKSREKPLYEILSDFPTEYRKIVMYLIKKIYLLGGISVRRDIER